MLGRVSHAFRVLGTCMATRRDPRGHHSYLSAQWSVHPSPEGRKFEIRNFLLSWPWELLSKFGKPSTHKLKVRFGLEHAMQSNVPQLTSAPLRLFGLGEKIGSGGYVGLPSF